MEHWTVNKKLTWIAFNRTERKQIKSLNPNKIECMLYTNKSSVPIVVTVQCQKFSSIGAVYFSVEVVKCVFFASIFYL